MGECCAHKKMRNDKERKLLTNRLSRIEGQIRGIKKMIEEDAYCIDVLNQVSAVSSAIGSFSKELLNEHIRTCVADDIIKGNTEKIDELSDIFKKFIK